MAMFCLMPQALDNFKAAIADGRVNPAKLAEMTSAERRKVFDGIVGENASKEVNSLFESKLLLKNQQAGYISWAKKVAGITPEVRRDIVSRIEKLDHVLEPEEGKQFLHDLASTKLGVDVTETEAKQIAELSKKITEAKALQRADGTFASESQRLAYGRAKVALGNYVGELKLAANKPTLRGLAGHPVQAVSHVAGFSKSIKAAFDDSALLRQNWKTLLTHPGLWAKNARKNLADLKNQGIKGEDVMREATADVVSRPNAKYYEKMGIAPKIEEEFGDPTLITKIPGVGRLYKTTEVAFNALMLRTRADLADYYLDLAKKANVNIDDVKELRPIGRMIGGMTGRGSLGSFEKVANTTNNVFFSPRFVKSQLDTVLHPITGAGGSNFVRKQAAINLTKIVGMTAAIFATANIISPGSVELDPRSSKFGKLKVGDTTFDLTGGFSSIAVLATRLYTQEYKSGTKGTVTGLGTNPSAPTGAGLVENFITGKLSPAAQRFWVNMVTKKEFNGVKPTLGSNLSNTFTPLPLSTYNEAKSDPHGANPIATEIADALGLSANTSNPAQQVKTLGKTDQALKSKIGDKKFEQYQSTYNDRLTTFLQSKFYKGLSNNQKQSAYTRAENKIRSQLYKDYNFKRPKSVSNTKLNKSVDNAIR